MDLFQTYKIGFFQLLYLKKKTVLTLSTSNNETLMRFLKLYVLSSSAHRTPNFMNPEFQFPQFKVLQSVFLFLFNIKSYIGIFGCIWYQFKTFIWKKYSKSKQTKYSGFAKLGVRWAERDICLSTKEWPLFCFSQWFAWKPHKISYKPCGRIAKH